MRDGTTLSLPVWPGRLKQSGTVIAGHADAAQRAAIAEALDLVALDRLSWTLTARPWRKRGLSLEGQVQAEVVQACVVTLEPVAAQIDEAVDLRFLPVDEGAPEDARDIDWAFDAAAEDEPDRFEGDMVDVGALVVEILSLALDPYPRKPGVDFSADFAGEQPADHAEGSNPALADALRKWQKGTH